MKRKLTSFILVLALAAGSLYTPALAGDDPDLLTDREIIADEGLLDDPAAESGDLPSDILQAEEPGGETAPEEAQAEVLPDEMTYGDDDADPLLFEDENTDVLAGLDDLSPDGGRLEELPSEEDRPAEDEPSESADAAFPDVGSGLLEIVEDEPSAGGEDAQNLFLRSEMKTLSLESADDNDELFEAYMGRSVFGLADTRMRLRSSSRLSGTDAVIYNLLREKIAAVAAGDLSDTAFSIRVEDIWGGKTSWTAQELGVESLITDGAISQEALAALKERTDYDFTAILRALLTNCPYDLYWFNKTAGVSYGGHGIYGNDSEISIVDYETFVFAVSEGYGTGHQVDGNAVRTAKTAAERARGIVESHAGKANYDKLEAYKDEICAMVDYNRPAANQETAYGDPWQLVWVFDDDPETKVVCEGYAKAFQYLFDLSSFKGSADCYTVTGSMSGGTGAGDHMWNVVRMEDGKNYLVDVTNSDTGTIGSDGSLFLASNAQGSVSGGYTFSCRGTNVRFTYDDITKSYFSEADLTLSPDPYFPVHIHTPAAPQITDVKAASCTAAGSHVEVVLCEECGEEISRTTVTDAPLKHVISIHVKRAEPTLKAAGNIEYWRCKDCGKYYADASGKKEITAAQTVIAKLIDIGSAKVTGIADRTYTGGAITQTPSVTVQGAALVKGKDYEAAFRNNINAGTASVVISGKGRYAGTKTVSFTILPKKITPTVTLSAVTYTYNGKVKTPSVTVKNGTQKMTSADYQVAYASGRKNVGVYKVKVTLKGNYSGSQTLSFKIIPRGTAFRKLSSPARGKLAVTWKKQAVQTTGYQVQYSLNRYFKSGNKVATVRKASRVSGTIPGLKAGRVYYVRIRTFRTIKGKHYFSAWSAVKRVKIRK